MNQPIHHTLPSLKLTLPEIRERRCPYCKADGAVPAGRVIGVAGLIKVEYRCAVCSTLFLHVRQARDWVRWTGPDHD